jgi:hypothetical protein
VASQEEAPRWHGRWHRIAIAVIVEKRQGLDAAAPAHRLTCGFATTATIRAGIETFKTAMSSALGRSGLGEPGIAVDASTDDHVGAPAKGSVSEHFTPEEIEQFDATRFAVIIDYRKAGRPAKTIMPKPAGLPAKVTQFSAQKELADALKKAAKHEPDSSLLLGIAAIAERLAENAVDQGQSEYWTEIMSDATLAWAELADEPEPAPKQGIPSSVLPPGMGWNPDMVPPENAPIIDAAFNSIINSIINSTPPRRGWLRRR